MQSTAHPRARGRRHGENVAVNAGRTRAPFAAEPAASRGHLYLPGARSRRQVDDLFARPQHPYTHGLMASIPRLALMRGENDPAGRLQEIPGMVPALTNLPQGCVFAPRCTFAEECCRKAYPPYEEKHPRHRAACWRSEELYGDRDG